MPESSRRKSTPSCGSSVSPCTRRSRKSMPDYFGRLAQSPELPERQTPLERGPKYHEILSSPAAQILSVALSTPGIENAISRELAARFNQNFDKYDAIIDNVYNETRIGGSELHHNLDGSHT